MSQAGQHGSAGGASAPAPPVGTPNEGGTGTADGASQGHSAEGSGNAAGAPPELPTPDPTP